MKIMGKRWLKNNAGFTLAELMVAMAVGGFVMAGVFAIMTQLFWVTSSNSNYMAAFRQVQNAGGWISHDALMAQSVMLDDPATPETEFITLGWTAWSGDQHKVVHSLEDTSGELKELKRSHYIKAKGTEDFVLQDATVIAECINSTNTSSDWDKSDKELTVTITAKVGDYVLWRHGTYAESATRTYKVKPRPLS